MTNYEIRARERARHVKELRHKAAIEIITEFRDKFNSVTLALWAVSHLGVNDTVDIIARHCDQYSIYHALNSAWRQKCRTFQEQR